MGMITGYTAEHMDEIANATIVGAHVSGDDLILEKHDGGTVNAGSVRGAIGPSGSGLDICSSTTHPSGGSLFEGLAIYETDTKKYLIYNGVRFDPPWNMPWGVISHVENIANQLNIGPASTDFTGLTTGPISYVGHRKVRISGRVSYGGASHGLRDFFLEIKEGGGIIQHGFINADIPSHVISVERIITPSAGVHTYRLAGSAQFTDTFDRTADTGFILVEDLGPDGVPV